MKRVMSLAVCLLLAGSIYAQTDLENATDTLPTSEDETALAYTKSQQKADAMLAKYHSTAIKTTGVNASYLNSTFLVDSPTYVKIAQQNAALFDLANTEVYDNSEAASYDVVFDSKRSTISVRYDDMGKIIYSKERFENIALPNAVIVSIMKQYPNYRFDANVCTINYAENKGINTTYKVMISHGKDKKTVKVDDKGNFI